MAEIAVSDCNSNVLMERRTSKQSGRGSDLWARPAVCGDHLLGHVIRNWGRRASEWYVKFYPYKYGMAKHVLGMLKMGIQTVCG